MSKRKSHLPTVAAFCLFAVVVGSTGWPTSDVLAQSDSQKNETTTDPDSLKKLIERINKLESEVERLKKTPAAANADGDPQVLVMLDVAHIGLLYAPTGQTRFLVLHVMLANTGNQAFTIARDQVIAELDGEERKLKEFPQQLQHNSVMSGKQHYRLADMKPPKEWRLPAGGQTGMWLVYPELPLGPNVPKCKIKVKLGETTKTIDVNELQRMQLNLDVERIGPRQALALCTIGGSINSFNAGSLVDALDKLVEQKVARVVLRWVDGSTAPDPQLMNWLQMAAAGNAGNTNANPMYPVIPAAIREFHLTEFPAGEDGQARNGFQNALRPTGQVRIHKTAADSVGAALRTAYLALPRDELLEEIRKGHPLTRAAALAYGGGRLDVEQLPQIFAWAEDRDPELQRAALQALSHFGEPQAIEKLVFYAQRNVEPLSSAAIESLAGSRFGAAHDALLALLKNEPAESRKKIVGLLAKYPRPIWSETLFDFVWNSSTGIDGESLKALVQVGHPQLVAVLERALKSPDKVIRDEAFRTLSLRSDQQSESLSVDYALKALEAGPPDATVIQLLVRTKEAKAIPLLLKQLETNNDRTSTINLLMQLGDGDVADKLVAKYSALNNNERVQILQGLKLFRHPKFRELCGEALATNDNQLVTIAATALSQDGSTESESLLIAALEKQKTIHLLGNIMNNLANFGTSAARAALIKARDSGDQTKKNYATQALMVLRQRSPGFQHYAMGENYSRNRQDKEALESFNTALQLDVELPEAYLGRGQLLLKQEKFGAARKDFEKVLELKHEPQFFSEFVTSLAIARIADGQLAEGIKYLEDNREANKKSAKGLFQYNAACAYSRAVEQVEKQGDMADRDKLMEKYRKQAIADLSDSFSQGFEDFAWAAKDPDFKALRGDTDFKKLMADKPTESPKPKDDDE